MSPRHFFLMAATAAALSCGASPSLAQVEDPGFALFKQACLDTRGDPVAAAAVVAGQDWTERPIVQPHLIGARTRIKSDGLQVFQVTTAKAEIDPEFAVSDVCQVHVQLVDGPVPGRDPAAAALRWLGRDGGPAMTEPTVTAFVLHGAERPVVVDQSAIGDHVASGDLANIIILRDGSSVLLMYATLRPATAEPQP